MVCKVAPKTSRPTINGEVEKTLEVVDYETALDYAGYGRFSLSVLFACILAFFATGVQNCVTSYVLPAARCELQLTTYQSGLINMAFMSGGVASAFFWGIVGDVYGRRRMISLTLLLDAVMLLAQSMVTDYRVLLAERTISGFLIGGPSTLTFSYLSDLVGAKKRQFYLNLVGMSFVAAWLILPAAAWLVIPFNLQAKGSIYPIYSWRLYMALGTLPALVGGIWVLCLPDSPRQLSDTNRQDEALKNLERIFRANGNQGEFKVKQLIPDSFVQKNEFGNQNRTKELFLGVMRDLRTLVSKAYAVKSLLILFAFYANMAAGFGLILWIPELLLRMKNRDCSSKAPESAKLFDVTNTTWKSLPRTMGVFTEVTTVRVNSTLEIWRGDTCNDTIDADVFVSGLIVGSMCLGVGVLCAAGGAGRGAGGVRRAAALCAAATAAAAAATTAACSCTPYSKITVAAAAVLNAASLNGNVLLIRMLLHALPPKLSGLGVCWGAWWGRAGGVASNLAVGALLDYSCAAPFLAVAALLAMSVVAIMTISFHKEPETDEEMDNRTPDDTLDKSTGLDRYISTHI